MITAKELREVLESVPDDTPVVWMDRPDRRWYHFAPIDRKHPIPQITDVTAIGLIPDFNERFDK